MIQQIETSGLIPGENALIPVVNQYGILASIAEIMGPSAFYDEGERNYIVEMAIPLVHLGLEGAGIGEGETKIEYTIRLRGLKFYGAGARPEIHRISPNNTTPERELHYERIKIEESFFQSELKGTYRLARDNGDNGD